MKGNIKEIKREKRPITFFKDPVIFVILHIVINNYIFLSLLT